MRLRIEWSSWTPVLLAGGTGMVLGALLVFLLQQGGWEILKESSPPSPPSLTIAVVGLAVGVFGLAVGLLGVSRGLARIAANPPVRPAEPLPSRMPRRGDDPPTVSDYWRQGSQAPASAAPRPQGSLEPVAQEKPRVPERPPAPVESQQPEWDTPQLTPASATTATATMAATSVEPSRREADSSLWPERLLAIWERYRTTSEGFFTARGLERVLRSEGVDAEVLPPEQLSAQDEVLGVVPPGANGRIYLLPSFALPARAVEAWFDDHGSGVRTAPVTRLHRVAVAERGPGGVSLQQKGVVA